MITLTANKSQLEIPISAERKSKTSNRHDLLMKFKSKLTLNSELTRSLVSFQANKTEPFYRWFRYKEAFSSQLVDYILNLFGGDCQTANLLDPFSGAGTALTTAASKGWNAVGIELLPVGSKALNARLTARAVNRDAFAQCVEKLKRTDLKRKGVSEKFFFKHLRITRGAFTKETELQLANYRKFTSQIKDDLVKQLFEFAAFSILEEISFTRKDGQYLRWDYRSKRNLKSRFSKGIIKSFHDAIFEKLDAMCSDLRSTNTAKLKEKVQTINGSCLEQMILFDDNSFDLVITSPPYCNRYDYTRTYALELAYLGLSEEYVKDLRQTLLSATVENKSKKSLLAKMYHKEGKGSNFDFALSIFDNQDALKEVLRQLMTHRDELNNKNIPEMVGHYFFEMTLLITEMARVLKAGGRIVMVNDNVQYHGEEVPVDLILSNIAEGAGLTVEKIWVLERGKGNSSQQMDAHGRNELRKCIYIWQKPSHG